MKRRHAGRGSHRQRCACAALAEDLAKALDESINTLEDAALHVSRLVPQLSSASSAAAQPPAAPQGQRRVVVLGTGWAAHAIAKIVDAAANDVCIVSPRNYFVFTPMLAAASVGTVEYRSILEHIRSANPTLRFYQGTCTVVDMAKHQIVVQPATGEGVSFSMPYDVLVVAVGTKPLSRLVPGVRRHCLFLKDIDDARKIRKRVTECFEQADLPTSSEEEKKRLLTFAVIGGGPTGCEFCGELSDFIRNDLRKFYPKLAPLVRILLVHRGETILPSFGEDLQVVAKETLEVQGIEVTTSVELREVTGSAITVRRRIPKARSSAGSACAAEDEEVPCGLCVWAAGNEGQAIVRKLHEEIPAQAELAAEEAGGSTARLFVDDWLRVVGVADGSIIAVGDCAQVAGERPPLPQTAQVAAQAGAYVARLLNRSYALDADGPPRLTSSAEWPLLLRARGQVEAPRFRFLDLGRLAYLGEEQAVAEVGLGSTTVSRAAGRAAFALWRSVYVVKQVSFRNRVLVLFDWVKSRVFGRDLTRF